MLDGTYGYDAVADAHFLMQDRVVGEARSRTRTREGEEEEAVQEYANMELKKEQDSSDLSTGEKKTNQASNHSSIADSASVVKDQKILLATEGCSCPGKCEEHNCE